MITVEKLQQFGADTKDGLGRCFGNEALYLRLVATVPTEGNFEKLRTSMANNDLDGGFEAAHALKGVLGNLSLTPICEPVTRITELLRARTQTDYSPLLSEIEEKRAELARLCED